MPSETCEIHYVDEHKVAQARANLPPDKALSALAETFKILGDVTRVRILHALFETELCVCDLSALVNATQSAVSHQLRLLKSARLVRSRKEGKMVYYTLDDRHVQTLFAEALRHVAEAHPDRLEVNESK